QVARLNLAAGKRAKASTAYASALTYFVAGRTLLPSDGLESRYELTFALEFQQAECEFLTGAQASAEERLSVLSRYAATLLDKGAVAWLRVTLYTALGSMDRAIETALAYLRGFGVEWSPHPTKDTVFQEYEPIAREIRSDSILGRLN